MASVTLADAMPPPSQAAPKRPSTAAAPSSTSFAPRPEQQVCSHLKGPESQLDEELRDRILRRVKDCANPREAAQTLFTKLDKNCIPSLAYFEGICEFKSMKPIDYGFEDSEVELLRLCDADWEKKYQSGWFDRYFETLPCFMKHKVVKEKVEKAINTAGISSEAEMFSRFEFLDLPKPFADYVRLSSSQALPSAEKEPFMAPLRCAEKRLISKGADRCNAQVDTCLSVAAKDAGKVLLHCDQHEDNSDDSAIASPKLAAAEQILAQAIYDLQSAGDVLHGAAELETGKSNDSDAEYAAIAAHSRENCDADGLGRSLEEDNIRDAAQQLIGFSTGLSQPATSNHQCAPSAPATELADLQRAAHRLILDLPSAKGVSGTLQPANIGRILTAAHTALFQFHGPVACDMVDLGCSVGHALAYGVLSGKFETIYGVDFPENKQSITAIFETFCTNAKQHDKLKNYAEKFRNVRFSWENAGASSLQNMEALLGVALPKPTLVYWFSVGWDAKDISQAAKVLSNSPAVLCVAIIAKGQGRDANRVLDDLNASPDQKPFRTVEKLPNLRMTGSGQAFTGYIMVRSRNFEYKLPTCDQRVEVLFEGLKWFSGNVSELRGEGGKIAFDDGESCDFKVGDSSVFFLPMMQNQWKPNSGSDCEVVSLLPNTYCFFCWHPANDSSVHCARCKSASCHLECLPGSLRNPNASQKQGKEQISFLCFVCRAELAESGRSQYPLYVGNCNGREPICFGCGQRLSVGSGANSKNGYRAKSGKRYHQCRLCKFLYGPCCSARTMDGPKTFSCPACVGISVHDEELQLILERMLTKMNETLVEVTRRKKVTAVDGTFMDDSVQAVVSLQHNCHWEGSAKILPVAVRTIQCQVDLDIVPSMAEFDMMNHLVSENGPSVSLFYAASKLTAKHRAQNACTPKSLHAPAPGNETPAHSTQADRITLGFLTADMRQTPWWSLYKAALINIAENVEVDMYIFSRPPCDLQTDPHFQRLDGLCTIVNFDALASDSTVADAVREKNVRVLVDGGGATFNTLSGVLGQRPAEIQIAHLGYPGDQPGACIDYTLVDQCVMDPDGQQARGAEERLMYVGCYQPNAAFRCPLPTSNTLRAVRQTTRADWNLPDNAFVFALFCRLGRVDSAQARCLASILHRTPGSVLWMRKDPLFAVLRLLRFFSKLCIPRDRIVLAENVPTDVHEERLRHANIGLDTRLYGGHTTCCDFLRMCKLFLSLLGPWFHNRVSYSLVSNLMGNDEFVAENLEDFERKAVLYFENPQLLEASCAAIRDALQNQTGIFDGEGWVDSFLRCIKEAIRQRERGEQLRDIYSVERIRHAPDGAREFVSVLDKMQPSRAQLAGTFQTECLHSVERSRHSEIPESQAPLPNSVEQGMMTIDSDAPLGQPAQAPKSKTRKDNCCMQWLMDLASSDRQQARLKALEYIKQQKPELASEMCYIRDDRGEEIPFIQLPCQYPRLSPVTGNIIAYDELPLLFVANGPHGKHLYTGQDYWKGMTLTLYDGKFIPAGEEVDDPSWMRSVAYNLGAVDGRGFSEFMQLEHNSLGHIANHTDEGSVSKYKNRFCKARISGILESIFLVAREHGHAFTEVTAFYTPGAARRHGIPKNPVSPGEDHIGDSLLDFAKAPVQSLRLRLGWDLMRLCGKGSYGHVIHVRKGERNFAVKIGNEAFHSSKRLGVLIEAAVMDIARQQTAPIGIFALQPEFGCGWDLSGCALIRAAGAQRLAAVAMELADCSARDIWKDMGKRFRALDSVQDERLLHNIRSVVSGTVLVVCWMHESNLVHGDLKPDNMLLKKLQGMPEDSRIAHCTVDGTTYQIVLCDWGHARWSGAGDAAVHVYSREVKDINSSEINLIAAGKREIVQVSLMHLRDAFGLTARRALSLQHPGEGTAWVRAPESDRQFSFGCDGTAQRRFDQAGDIWALGAICARACAAPEWAYADKRKEDPSEKWRETLYKASSAAEMSLQRIEATEKQLQKIKAGPGTGPPSQDRSKRIARDHISTLKKPNELWIQTMVQQHYSGDVWPCLYRCTSGKDGAEWRSLLDLTQRFLAYSSTSRLTAKEAMEHPFLSRSQGSC